MRLVFFDIETGGLDKERHPVIQLAAVAVDRGLAELASFEAKIAFDVSQADAEALTKNCYNAETWASDARPDTHVCNEFSRFLKRFADVEMISQRTGNPYNVAQLIGHNADSFDGPFIQAWYRRLGQFMPAAFRVFCTYQRAMHHFHENANLPKPENFKLEGLCKYFGIEHKEAHDALADVRANIAVYKALRSHGR